MTTSSPLFDSTKIIRLTNVKKGTSLHGYIKRGGQPRKKNKITHKPLFSRIPPPSIYLLGRSDIKKHLFHQLFSQQVEFSSRIKFIRFKESWKLFLECLDLSLHFWDLGFQECLFVRLGTLVVHFDLRLCVLLGQSKKRIGQKTRQVIRVLVPQYLHKQTTIHNEPKVPTTLAQLERFDKILMMVSPFSTTQVFPFCNREPKVGRELSWRMCHSPIKSLGGNHEGSLKSNVSRFKVIHFVLLLWLLWLLLWLIVWYGSYKKDYNLNGDSRAERLLSYSFLMSVCERLFEKDPSELGCHFVVATVIFQFAYDAPVPGTAGRTVSRFRVWNPIKRIS